MPPSAASSLSFRLPLMLPLLLLLALQLSPAVGQGYRNVSLGSTITTQGTTTSWLSPSGDFAFGFLPTNDPGSTDNFLLAVWFAKIPEKTPVWFLRTKDGGTPLLQVGSRVDLTMDGRLVLTDHTGNRPWTAPAGAAAYAAMLDSGNFVLVSGSGSANGGYRWQSFSYPTDTILPTQQLPLGTDILARLQDTDYSNGRFKLAVQANGNLVLCPLSLAPKRDPYKGYLNTGTTDSGTSLIFNTSGDLYMANRNGSVTMVTMANVSTSEFYQRATLDPDGVFRHYQYQKNSATGWSLSMQIPDNICRQLTSPDVGSGACGYYALCTMVNQRPDCNCLEGYSFIDPKRKYMGCQPQFMPQSCSSDGGDTEAYQMLQMQDADWPYQDFEHFSDIDEESCSDRCFKDCFCAAAVYGTSERGCWLKKQPLGNGRMVSGIGRKAFLKISNNISSGGLPTNKPMIEKKKNRGLAVLPSALLISGLVFIIMILGVGLLSVLFWMPQRGIAQYQQMQQQQTDLSMLDSTMRRFAYKELEHATEGFKEELGRGAFGIVYKGTFSAGVQFAAKKLDKLDLKDDQAEKEFATEVKAIGLTHHKNLVRLLGYCNEDDHRLLVYEFLSNGSLTSLLFGGSVRLRWTQRSTIACGIATGLLYLHEECTRQIIHCDIKPQNVLLDEHLNPKISDFGMAKLLGTDQTRTATGIRGTKGYVAPEWFRPVPVTAKIDVYSFGVMLLEIICCKRAVEPVYLEDGGGSEAEILTFWVYDCYKEGRLNLLVADDLEAMADIDRVQRFVMVALWCIQEDPTLRPSMKKVTQMLEGAIQVSSPPDPSLFFC